MTRRHRLDTLLRTIWAATAAVALVALATFVVVMIVGEQARAGQHGTEQLYPGRPDATGRDVEVAVGRPADVDGLRILVLDGGFERAISDLEPDGYLVLHVALENTGGATMAYARNDWSARTPLGVEVPAAVTTQPDLGSGTLGAGERVEGDLFFEIGDVTGLAYVAYERQGVEQRPVWQIGTTFTADDE